MKRIITIILVAIMTLPVAVGVNAQDKKAERKARKELRKQERAIKDSLMTLMRMAEGDSVNVGYGYTGKKRLNESVSRLKGSDDNIESYSNIADYIQGRVPGVMVRREGETCRYIIRGVSTNSDATDPLLMIDGVEVSDFDSLLPSQVESVEVLKDASASIYGMKGAGGVIMITTKKF